MITTRDADIKIIKSKSKYKTKTTKGIDATLPYDKNPKTAVKKEMVTTHNIEDIIKQNRMARARVAKKKGRKK